MNNSGKRMLSARATLPALGWLVFLVPARAEASEAEKMAVEGMLINAGLS
jgi:hypothetical protein